MREAFILVAEQPSLNKGDWNFEYLQDDADVGLRIGLRQEYKVIEIRFSNPFAYRTFLEETQASFWPIFHANKSEGGTIYSVKNSEWLHSFKEEDLIHYDSPTHFLIVTANHKIDVLATTSPVFKDIA